MGYHIHNKARTKESQKELTGSAKRAMERSKRRMFSSGRNRRAFPSYPRYAYILYAYRDPSR